MTLRCYHLAFINWSCNQYQSISFKEVQLTTAQTDSINLYGFLVAKVALITHKDPNVSTSAYRIALWAIWLDFKSIIVTFKYWVYSSGDTLRNLDRIEIENVQKCFQVWTLFTLCTHFWIGKYLRSAGVVFATLFRLRISHETTARMLWVAHTVSELIWIEWALITKRTPHGIWYRTLRSDRLNQACTTVASAATILAFKRIGKLWPVYSDCAI